MRTIVEKVIPARTVKETSDDITCDVCSKIYRHEIGQYQKCETSVSIEEGYHYPEGGHVKKTFVDVCPDCFENKLLPFLKKIAKHPVPHTKDCDF
jgi:hypothetical protein